jgi:hypothetical protein
MLIALLFCFVNIYYYIKYMREYIEENGDKVDLDDPKTYEYLPKDWNELRTKMFKHIGYSYCYMNFWHKDVYFYGQEKRVLKLVKRFTDGEQENRGNILWIQEIIFLFEDEIENMC